MDEDLEFQKKLNGLRQRAQARLAGSSADEAAVKDPETRRLLHDLHVHQIELEMQNEELRQAQAELEYSRDRYLELYHNAPVGYVVADSAGIVLQANKTFGNMLDREIAALLNKPLAHFIHPDDRSIFFSRFRAFYKNPADKRLEVRMVRKDESVLDAKLEGRRIGSGDNAASERDLSGQLLISLSDITKRKAAQRAIIQSKQQWEQTFDAVPDLIAIIDGDANIVRVNQALARRLGVQPEACIGKKCYKVLHERRVRPADCPHQRFLRTGRACDAEYYSRKFNAHFITSVSPFDTDTPGNMWSIHISHDITDRKRAEAELLKSRNLESIGTLAGGIAHDFNNIFTALVGHIDLARLFYDDRTRALRHLESATESLFRARDLAGRLLTFAEGGEPRRQSIEIDQLLEEITALSLSGTSVKYELLMAPDLHSIVVDKAQVKSAIQNIIANAREAMPWGGQLTVKAMNVDLTNASGNPVEPGRYVRIDFMDKGPGVDPKHLEKIFDPYFTTKQMGAQKGMGLGLAICHSIIKKHRGHISVRSQAGQGTTVTLFLPASVQPSDKRTPLHLTSAGSDRSSRRLLVMDDEKIIWDVVDPIIKEMGCRVDFAIDGRQALELYRRSLDRNTPYAVVILDLTIRGGDGGKEVIRRIHQLDPAAKAIVLSGYSTDPVFADYRHYGFAGALKKPFTVSKFIHLVSKFIETSVSS